MLEKNFKFHPDAQLFFSVWPLIFAGREQNRASRHGEEHIASSMKFVVACEDTGAIKVVAARHGTDTSKPSEDTVPGEAAVTISTHATDNTRKDKVLQLVHSQKSGKVVVSRMNGSVEVYDASKLQQKQQQQPAEEGEAGDGGEEADLLPLVYEQKALIASSDSNDAERFTDLVIDDSGRVVVATNRGSLFVWPSEEEIGSDPARFTLPLNENESIESVQVHPGKENVNYIAYAGKETDLRVVKLPSAEKKKKGKKQQKEEQPQVVFKAKNLANSRLELRVPIHIKKILFGKTSTPDHLQIYTFTQWGDMRYYDSSLGRKPRSSVLVLPKKAPIINAIWVADNLVLCDNTGIVVKVDPSTGAQLSKFKGQIGTTQALDNFQDTILATTGSDRYIRAYDNETRECIVKVFVGTQSNAIAIVEDSESLKSGRKNRKTQKVEAAAISAAGNQENEQEEESSDEEELWNKLESNITQRRKRRKLTFA